MGLHSSYRLAPQEDMLVTFVTVATKQHFELTRELMGALLTFNSRLDHVKVYLDSNGDMTVRCDSSVRVLDLQRFNEVMDQVAGSANEVYEGIQSFLTKWLELKWDKSIFRRSRHEFRRTGRQSRTVAY